MVPRNDCFYVPWADSTEWNDVRNQISSSEINQMRRGYETILMWKLKYNSLPAYVESTLSLLQVIIKKTQMTRVDNYSFSLYKEHELRLACSTALIRFVNHVSSIGAGKSESLYWSAKTQNIPDWVINMRHEAAHSQDLPTLDAFDAALDISFKWLLDNYWNKKHDDVLKKKSSQLDNEWRNSDLNSESNVRLGELFKKAFDIWDYSLRKKDVFTSKMKQEFLQHMEEFLNIKNTYFKEIKINKVLSVKNLIDFLKRSESGSNEVSPSYMVRKIKSALLKLMQTMLQTNIEKQVFINSLLESSFLTESNLKFGKWQKILEGMHKVKLFEALLKSLFEMAGKGHEKASKWLVILHPSIKLHHKKWTMLRTLRKEKNCDVKKLKKKIEIIHEKAYHHQLLNLNLSKPPRINLEMMSGVLMNPETHHLKQIIQYLKFIKPPLPESTVKLINSLIHTQELAESDNEDKDASENYDRIYTVDDLKNSTKRSNSFAFNIDNSDEDGWIKCEIDVHALSKCPLGLLPFQTRVDCNLPTDLKWLIKRRQTNEVMQFQNDFPLV